MNPNTQPTMTPEQVAATRRLVGLTIEQFSKKINNTNPRTVRAWETGKYSPGPLAVTAMKDLRTAHDKDLNKALALAEKGQSVVFPQGNDELPNGWWLAVASRILDRFPEASMKWASGE